ncbi:hypothetical protein FZD47_02380 [Bacillus infantis]|uniref:Uncharacterized protein n=1 Tax=Bacillus infantis TaxID=324767 RepID=A0A5D4SSQ6_9BACI|nr:hypothetical protein [Bacillus infantis]TYS66353.1 hypothetical protein FZD47_02380 [Bacillus infantis]
MYLRKNIKAFLLENEKEDFTNFLNELRHFHQEKYIKKLTIHGPRPKTLIGQNSIVFIQTNLFRAQKLAYGYIDSLNKQNPLLGTLSARAHFETTGALALFLKRYLQYHRGKIDLELLDNTLKTLYLGVKDKAVIPEAPDPFNVMKLIDAVDDVLRTEYNFKEQIFRTYYNDLSETSHPNSFGYFLGHNFKDKGRTVLFTGETEPLGIREYNIDAFYAGAEMYIQIYNRTRELIEQNEDLPFEEYKTK